MLPDLPAVEIASHAAPVHRDRSSARPDGAGCCRFDRQTTHVVTQRQRLSSRRRCQSEPVLRAGDDLWRWNDAGGSYQIALEEPRIIKIVQARHSSRSALRPQRVVVAWKRSLAGGRAGPRSKIQTKPSYCILYLVARVSVTYIISQ